MAKKKPEVPSPVAAKLPERPKEVALVLLQRELEPYINSQYTLMSRYSVIETLPSKSEEVKKSRLDAIEEELVEVQGYVDEYTKRIDEVARYYPLVITKNDEILFSCELVEGELKFDGSNPEKAAWFLGVMHYELKGKVKKADKEETVFWTVRPTGEVLEFGGPIHEADHELSRRFEAALQKIYKGELSFD